MLNVVIMDAQGGGIGKSLTEQLKKLLPQQRIVAVGTNSLATAAMLKAGADQGATGENAIRVTAASADLILGPIGLVLCDAMLGEITGVMACAVGSSPAHKILVPVNKCQLTVAGCEPLTMSEAVSRAVREAVQYLEEHS